MLYEVNQDALRYELEHLGVYKPGVAIMLGKGKITPLKILHVRTPAANIIKQEMLAAGGDCATPGAAISCSVPHADILLLGNQKHYKTLVFKLKQMPYFGIPDVVAELERYLAAVPKCTLLADGRLLRYDSVKVMGIINVTPDSFYAGSRKNSIGAVLNQAERMLAEGAAVLDIGGESTRPGSDPVMAEEERERVLPAIRAVKKAFPEAVVSVDTYRAALAKDALRCGADIINDISAMTADDAMPDVVAETQAPIILMHRKGTSKDMQQQCEYINVVQEVTEYLLGRAALLQELRIGPDKIILDPGIGFAKNDEQNLRLIQNLNALTVNEYPVLLAASRKATIGNVLGENKASPAEEAGTVTEKDRISLPPEERLEGTLAVTAAAVYAGASLVRVHDVKENVRLIRMLEAIRKV
ncbi:MAG: dihydropteroate synthase [Acidaminococcaceae bacterium]|nr:dihydropteroate synthase [Acidaminococcaceae bacterium]